MSTESANRDLVAIDLHSGQTFDLDPKRPKASLAGQIGYAASSGVPMRQELKSGATIQTGYVFGSNWYALEWRTYERWEK